MFAFSRNTAVMSNRNDQRQKRKSNRHKRLRFESLEVRAAPSASITALLGLGAMAGMLDGMIDDADRDRPLAVAPRRSTPAGDWGMDAPFEARTLEEIVPTDESPAVGGQSATATLSIDGVDAVLPSLLPTLADARPSDDVGAAAQLVLAAPAAAESVGQSNASPVAREHGSIRALSFDSPSKAEAKAPKAKKSPSLPPSGGVEPVNDGPELSDPLITPLSGSGGSGGSLEAVDDIAQPSGGQVWMNGGAQTPKFLFGWTEEGEPIEYEELLYNDIPDTPGGSIDFNAIVSYPTDGTITTPDAYGAFTYTPDLGYDGSDWFTYNITDGVNVSYPGMAQIEVAKPVIDLDTDSDNTGSISGSDHEDSVELGSGVPGKRIFVNYDDDNQDGKPDNADTDYPTLSYSDNDMVPVALKFPHFNFPNFGGYEILLDAGSNSNVRVWEDKQRNVPSGVSADSVDGEEYWWDLTAGSSCPFPATMYVEGVGLGGGMLTFTCFDPDGEVFSQDIVEFSIEKPVWPGSDTVSFDPTAASSTWPGFQLAEGWYMEKSRDELILDTSDVGYIRTHYPIIQDGEKRGYDKKALDARSTNPFSFDDYPNGYVIEADFTFDGSNYVQAYHSDESFLRERHSFFRNSGVYIFNGYEINIFDTKSMLADWGVTANTATDDYVSGYELYHKYTKPDGNADTWHEPVSGTITGIPYHLENKTYADLLAADTILNAGSNTLRIYVAPPGTFSGGSQGIDVVVYLNAEETFMGNIGGPTTTDPLGGNATDGITSLVHLQSHWGSGVKFTSVTIVSR